MDVNNINNKNFKNENIFKFRNSINCSLKNRFLLNNSIIKFLIFVAFLILFVACVSSVSAAENFANTTNVGNNIQDLINNPTGDNEIILSSGNYTDSIKNLNISREVTIKGNGKVNIISSNGGTLFNITSKNVKFINLNIIGYQSAIRSNTGGLSVVGCNITTTDISINCTGSNLNNILLEDNNITSSVSNKNYGAIYINTSVGSSASVTFKNNNITANGLSDSIGVYIYSYVCDNTLIFENNNITSSSREGVYLYVHNSINNISIINNNITGSTTYWAGLYFEAHTSKNTINISKNKILGTNSIYAVYMWLDESENNITFTNNDIIGDLRGLVMSLFMSNTNNITCTGNNFTGSKEFGVQIVPAMGSNGTLTFTNNNITGYFSGFYLDGFMSSLTIICTDNNITAISEYTVCMYLSNSKNTIVFSGNTIKGGFIGIYMDISYSTNNVTFTNNKIEGYYSLYMVAYCDNNIITLNNNTIKGETGVSLAVYGVNNKINLIDNTINTNDYGMVVTTWYRFSGLSLLNNTFNSNNIGLYFDLNGNAFLDDILIKGNTIIGTNCAITFNEDGPSSVNITVNYNRILAKIGLDYVSVSNDAGSNFDYNWWGINDISDKVLGFNTNNHYILSFTNLSNLDNILVGDKISFALLVLNTTMTNEGVENMPYFVITGTFNGINFNTNLNNLFIYEFTVSKEGLQFLEASLDEQYIDLFFDAFKLEGDIDNPNSNTTNPNTGSNDFENESDDELVFTKTVNDKNTNETQKNHITTTDNRPPERENVSKANFTGKKTGVPIVILLIIAIIGFLTYRRNY